MDDRESQMVVIESDTSGKPTMPAKPDAGPADACSGISGQRWRT